MLIRSVISLCSRMILAAILMTHVVPVSYTHLDVYKRQI